MNQAFPIHENEYIISYDAERRPFNCHMILPLTLLQKLTPIIKDPILKGLIDSDGSGRVILHIMLNDSLLLIVTKVVTEFEMEVLSARCHRA